MVLLIPTGGERQKLIPLKGYSLDLILSNEGVPTVLSSEPVSDAASGLGPYRKWYGHGH